MNYNNIHSIKHHKKMKNIKKNLNKIINRFYRKIKLMKLDFLLINQLINKSKTAKKVKSLKKEYQLTKKNQKNKNNNLKLLKNNLKNHKIDNL